MADPEPTSQAGRVQRVAGAVALALLAAAFGAMFSIGQGAYQQSRPIVADPPTVAPEDTSFTFRNEATREQRIHWAYFKVLEPPAPKSGFGELSPPVTIEFHHPQHYDAARKLYQRHVTDLKALPGEQGIVAAKIIDSGGNRRWLYGRLSLKYGDRANLRDVSFDPTWIQVVPADGE